jgi:hypothetical protein
MTTEIQLSQKILSCKGKTFHRKVVKTCKRQLLLFRWLPRSFHPVHASRAPPCLASLSFDFPRRVAHHVFLR